MESIRPGIEFICLPDEIHPMLRGINATARRFQTIGGRMNATARQLRPSRATHRRRARSREIRTATTTSRHAQIRDRRAPPESITHDAEQCGERKRAEARLAVTWRTRFMMRVVHRVAFSYRIHHQQSRCAQIPPGHASAAATPGIAKPAHWSVRKRRLPARA